jgi:DNA-binding NarL/FixJ family response regulator
MADDHMMVLEAFKHLIENEFEVVGTASDGRTLIEAAARLKPDVIVLDISMPLLNGLDAGRQLKQLAPSVKLVYVTMDQDADLAAQAFRLGASGYLLKNSASSELPKAIREAAMGRSYVTPLVTEGMVGSFLHSPERSRGSHKLTPRQREVVQLLAEGRAMKEVANILDITPRTVAFHKYTVMEQQQIKSNAELIQFAIKQHLVVAQN